MYLQNKCVELYGDEIRKTVREKGKSEALLDWGTWMSEIIEDEQRKIQHEAEERKAKAQNITVILTVEHIQQVSTAIEYIQNNIWEYCTDFLNEETLEVLKNAIKDLDRHNVILVRTWLSEAEKVRELSKAIYLLGESANHYQNLRTEITIENQTWYCSLIEYLGNYIAG